MKSIGTCEYLHCVGHYTEVKYSKGKHIVSFRRGSGNPEIRIKESFTETCDGAFSSPDIVEASVLFNWIKTSIAPETAARIIQLLIRENNLIVLL